jgi:hypothetical protein
MNQEDILRMAREIGEFLTPVSEQDYIELERFAKQVAQAEREACANLVFHSPPSDEYESPLKAVYEAIRARSQA